MSGGAVPCQGTCPSPVAAETRLLSNLTILCPRQHHLGANLHLIAFYDASDSDPLNSRASIRAGAAACRSTNQIYPEQRQHVPVHKATVV